MENNYGYLSTCNEWLNMITSIQGHGYNVICRGHKIKELLCYRSCIKMASPLLTLSKRGLGYKFACAEAAWILSGDNRVATIRPYSKMIESFSDDGAFFFGAYGPKIVEQIQYIGSTLKKDIHSRQAVLTIWRERPAESKDIPCTISVQFLVREYNGKLILHLVDNMRSSDSWLGVPYDWFSFSMLGAFFCIYFKKLTGIKLTLGNLYLYCASQHLYQNSFGYSSDKISRCIITGINEMDFTYKDLDPHEFETTDDFIMHLRGIAEMHCLVTESMWLNELITYMECKHVN